jgi:CRP-like cAMP-binding protein
MSMKLVWTLAAARRRITDQSRGTIKFAAWGKIATVLQHPRCLERNDIAVLAPDPTARLQRAHFEPGDEVIRQGDEGETAYVIESGRLEVLKDGSKLGELGEGDCFGEIALLCKVRRTAPLVG